MTGSSRSRGRSIALVLVVCAFAGFMFVVPGGIASGDEFRNNDWLNCRSFDVLTRQALFEHGQFPLRSHLVGGGFPTIAHPSDGSWAPTILAVLLFGDVLGVKINLLFFLLIGAWGVRRLAGSWLQLDEDAALFCALLFALSGWLPSMLLVGFYNQVFFFLCPAILALLLESKGRPDRLLWAGFLYFVVLQQGGHAYPAIGYFLAVVLWFVAAGEGGEAGSLRPWWRPGLLLLALCAAPALASFMDSVVPLVAGWGIAAAWVALSTQFNWPIPAVHHRLVADAAKGVAKYQWQLLWQL